MSKLVDLDWLHQFLKLLTMFLFTTLRDILGVLFIVTTLIELHCTECAFFAVVFPIQ